ncbi:MAG TPA: outer membrane beta-barrel protein [Gemmatimonadales bacterium]|nr:outer membrane beta-barrel protein [Gemmatimonadales bacterium]
MSKRSWLAAVACLLGMALPATAVAQVEFTPFFASYYAVTNIDDAFQGDASISEKQYAAPGFGARLTYWMGRSLGIEGAGSFAFSGTRFVAEGPGGSAGASLAGTIMTGSARILYRLPRTNFHMLLGGGVVSRGGDTWDFGFITSKTDIGGVVGFGVRAAITPKLALNVNLESFLYQADPDGDGSEYEGKMQADIYVIIGVPISFGGR